MGSGGTGVTADAAGIGAADGLGSVILNGLRYDTDSATFTIEDDCDTNESGLSIQVQGTSNATAGSPVELSIGSGPPRTALVSNGTYSDCVQAPDGEDQTLSATVTDSATVPIAIVTSTATCSFASTTT